MASRFAGGAGRIRIRAGRISGGRLPGLASWRGLLSACITVARHWLLSP